MIGAALLLALAVSTQATAQNAEPQFFVSECSAECVFVDLEWTGDEEFADALFTLSKPGPLLSVTLSPELDAHRLLWSERDEFVRVLIVPDVIFPPIPTFSQGELAEICFDVTELAPGCHAVQRFDPGFGGTSSVQSVGDANGQSVPMAFPPIVAGAVAGVASGQAAQRTCGLVGLEGLLVAPLAAVTRRKRKQ